MEILGLIITIMLASESTLGFQPGTQQVVNWSNEASPQEGINFEVEETDEGVETDSLVSEDASDATLLDGAQTDVETDVESTDDSQTDVEADVESTDDSQTDVEADAESTDDSRTETDSNTTEPADSQETLEKDVPAVDTVLNGQDGNYYQVTEEGSEVALFKLGVEVTSLVIPDTIEVGGITYIVTSIVRDACRGNTKIKSVEIGSQVREIGRSAFHDCTKLKEIAIGENVEEIGPGAFQDCKKLSSLTIPGNVESIGTHAFYGCKKLKEINIESQKLTSETVGRDVWKKVSDEVTVTVPSDYLESYSEILLSSGLPDEATIQAE